jgi:hypothetical protein
MTWGSGAWGDGAIEINRAGMLGVAKTARVGLATEIDRAGPLAPLKTPSLEQLAATFEVAERLLCYFRTKPQRASILRPLEQEYRADWFPDYGPREAWWIFWTRFALEVLKTIPWKIWAAILGLVCWLWSKLGG